MQATARRHNAAYPEKAQTLTTQSTTPNHDPDHQTSHSAILLDPYRFEPTATAIAAAELLHAGEAGLAGSIVENTDPLLLLEGFTNTVMLAVQLISRYGGVPESEVFGLIRAGNALVEGASGGPELRLEHTGA